MVHQIETLRRENREIVSSEVSMSIQDELVFFIRQS